MLSTTLHTITAIVVVTAIGLTGLAAPANAERLGSYNIDPESISISGISSGAFMANQFHIAHSKIVMGAGIVAGGLYGCAVSTEVGDKIYGTVTRAFDRCMSLLPGALEGLSRFVERTEQYAKKGWIDSLDGLAGDRVYMFTGRADDVVNQNTVHLGRDLYAAFGVHDGLMEFHDSVPVNPDQQKAGHSWVTINFGQPCNVTKSPFINDCDYDQAKAILTHIYGELEPPATQLSGTFVEFDQKEFIEDGKTAENGLWDSGYLYVPESCFSGSSCKLHINLHGCQQSTEQLGDLYYKNIGLNEWADTNDIIILYPQARKIEPTISRVGNPMGCWNWWGYANDKRFLVKEGIQISTIYKMIQRLTGES